ncbi:MAG: hypothetical protein ABIK96_13155 [bacterium]
MSRLLVASVLLLCLGPGAGQACPDATAAPAAGDGTPRLRNWHVGLQAVTTWRNRFDVFGLADQPRGSVGASGWGGGLFFGRRFGDRFLLDLHTTVAKHGIRHRPTDGTGAGIHDVEFLVTGTVLFRETRTLQPFLRGGIGGGGEVLSLADDSGDLFAFGTAAQAGGGVQIRLSDRVSLEMEAAATFTNFLEVHDESRDDLWPDETWQVRTSNRGWRFGSGLVIWF